MSRPRLSAKIVSPPVITGLAILFALAKPAAESQTNNSSLGPVMTPANAPAANHFGNRAT
jgi:hypothetical protein